MRQIYKLYIFRFDSCLYRQYFIIIYNLRIHFNSRVTKLQTNADDFNECHAHNIHYNINYIVIYL